jgi:putative transcriptional regulator
LIYNIARIILGGDQMIIFKLAEIMGKHKVNQKIVSEATGIRPNTISQLWHGTSKRLEVDQVNKLYIF